jgi:hypothetical protein
MGASCPRIRESGDANVVGSVRLKSRRGKRKEIDADDLVLVDANPRFGAFGMTWSHVRICESVSIEMIFAIRNIHTGGACLTDDQARSID